MTIRIASAALVQAHHPRPELRDEGTRYHVAAQVHDSEGAWVGPDGTPNTWYRVHVWSELAAQMGAAFGGWLLDQVAAEVRRNPPAFLASNPAPPAWVGLVGTV